MLAKLLVPAFLALSVSAATTTASVCTQSTATINSQADVTSLADCATISGTIVVSAKATGVISIDGPQKIIGDVICENAGGLITLGSSSITTINGAMKLTNLTLLSSLSMSSLKTCDTINWVALPALPQLGFSSVLTKSNSITISNTFLSTLDGIDIDTASTLQIDNNNQLKTFTTKATTVTSAININANANTLVASFPNLIWAANMTLRNASSVSIPALTAVNGSLGFYGNYMTSIAAPNLTSVGSLAFVANAKLANISVPILKTIGGANQIANNSALNAIDFPALTNVGGAIDFSGAFSTPKLPALVSVKGGFNIQSTQQIDCSAFAAEAGIGKVILGTFICKTTANATTLGSSTSTGSSSGSTSTSKGAAVSYGISESVAAFSVLGGLLQMLL